MQPYAMLFFPYHCADLDQLPALDMSEDILQLNNDPEFKNLLPSELLSQEENLGEGL